MYYVLIKYKLREPIHLVPQPLNISDLSASGFCYSIFRRSQVWLKFTTCRYFLHQILQLPGDIIFMSIHLFPISNNILGNFCMKSKMQKIKYIVPGYILICINRSPSVTFISSLLMFINGVCSSLYSEFFGMYN